MLSLRIKNSPFFVALFKVKVSSFTLNSLFVGLELGKLFITIRYRRTHLSIVSFFTLNWGSWILAVLTPLDVYPSYSNIEFQSFGFRSVRKEESIIEIH